MTGAALLPFLLCAAAGPTAPLRQDFSSWSAICDNTLDCITFGFPERDDADGAWIAVRRGGAANAVPTITVSRRWDGQQVSVMLRLLFADGNSLHVRSEKSEPGSGLIMGVLATPVQANLALKALRTADTLRLAAGSQDDEKSMPGEAKPTVLPGYYAPDPLSAEDGTSAISLKGAAAALRWVDAQQHRVGTVTALVAKGPRPADAVPLPPVVPVVRTAPYMGGESLHDGGRVPESVRALIAAHGCGGDLRAGGRSLSAYTVAARLAKRLTLWGIPCGGGAYNTAVVFALLDEESGRARLAQFSRVPGTASNGDPLQDNTLTSASFDAATAELSSRDLVRARGDCGRITTYGWNGQAFRLVAIRESPGPECHGVPPDQWAEVFRSRQQ